VYFVCVCVCGGAFPNARGVGMAAVLDVVRHTCYSSPPTALLAMNSACSQAPGSHLNDTFSIAIWMHFISTGAGNEKLAKTH